jgi:hypothetical protein
LLAGFKTHPQQERPILGDRLYERAAIDQLAPYPTLRVPAQCREASGYEPDLVASQR